MTGISPSSSQVKSKPTGGWRGALRLTAREVGRVDAVAALLELTGHFDAVRHNGDRLFVVLSELYNNALDHGLLALDSRLKRQTGGMDAWMAERAARLAALVHGEIEIEIEQLTESYGGLLRVVCQDSGRGFDHKAFMMAHAADEQPWGRGLMLLRAMCVDLVFNDAGNRASATLTYDFSDDCVAAHNPAGGAGIHL